MSVSKKRRRKTQRWYPPQWFREMYDEVRRTHKALAAVRKIMPTSATDEWIDANIKAIIDREAEKQGVNPGDVAYHLLLKRLKERHKLVLLPEQAERSWPE